MIASTNTKSITAITTKFATDRLMKCHVTTCAG